MAAEKKPSDIARQALMQLASRRLPPTPENYQALYNEVAGVRNVDPFPKATLLRIASLLPAQTPAQRRLLDELRRAIDQASWSAVQSVWIGYAQLGLAAHEPPLAQIPGSPLDPHEPAPAGTLDGALAQELARCITHVLESLDTKDSGLLLQGQQLVDLLGQPLPSMQALTGMLGNFAYRLSFATDEGHAIRDTQQQMLRMVFEHIPDLHPGDGWLQRQTEALLAAIDQPMTLPKLQEVQLRLKDVLFRQMELQERQQEAQEQMKKMLAAFLERLARITQSSGDFESRMDGWLQRISQAQGLDQMAPVLEEIMGATRAMALDSRVAHEELSTLRERTEAAQAELDRLRAELDQAGEHLHNDPLTGLLNRRGLEAALTREVARSQRQLSPLALAVLDLDNFRLLNERLSPEAGDAALRHLADLARQHLRAQDLMARPAGQEFVLVLPDTARNEALETLQRLQRALSTELFMHGDEHVLITFSAGVAQVMPHETPSEARRRAEEAMYQAKRTGKNRVVAAP